MLKNFRTYQLAVELYRECETLKAKHYFKDQLMRASLSVVLNIAEGSAKTTDKERARFYGIALASCRETQALLALKNDTKKMELADKIGGGLYRLTHR